MPNSLGSRLERISGLTPGDFKVVYQKNVFNEKKPALEFLKELENEVSYKNAIAKRWGRHEGDGPYMLRSSGFILRYFQSESLSHRYEG
jgi:hypothetical protein